MHGEVKWGTPPPSQNPPQPPTPKPSKDKPILKGRCSLSHLHLKAGRLNHLGQLTYACGLSANPLNPPQQELLALPCWKTIVLLKGPPLRHTHTQWMVAKSISHHSGPLGSDALRKYQQALLASNPWLHFALRFPDFARRFGTQTDGTDGTGTPWPAAIDPTACVAEKSTRCTATSSSFSRLSCLPRPKASGSGGSPWKFPSNTPPGGGFFRVNRPKKSPVPRPKQVVDVGRGAEILAVK